MSRLLRLAPIALLTACGVKASTTSGPVTAPGNLPPVREISAPTAQFAVATRTAPQVRPLSSGALIVHDMIGHRLSRVNPEMETSIQLLDRTNPVAVAFPVGSGHLIAAKADTTYVLDIAAQVYRIVDPDGKVVSRIPAESRYLRALGSMSSAPSFDDRGRLLYADATRPGPTTPGIQPQPDSVTIARISLDKTGRDSLGVIGRTPSKVTQTNREGQRPLITTLLPAVEVGDAWAVTSDGAVAIIRASNFHVDWIEPDGRRVSSPPVAWPWHRYSNAEKDSLRRLQVGRGVAGSEIRISGITTMSNPAGGLPFEMAPPQFSKNIPDVAPAFVPNSARADLEGRIWILLGAQSPGQPSGPAVYGVIDRQGQMVDRVQFPAQRTIAGFGPGLVYMAAPGAGGYTLERYKYR